MGLHPKKLVVTVSVKSRRLVQIAVKHQILIVLDNSDEFELVEAMAHEFDLEVIFYRRQGFCFRSLLADRQGTQIQWVGDFIPEEIG